MGITYIPGITNTIRFRLVSLRTLCHRFLSIWTGAVVRLRLEERFIVVQLYFELSHANIWGIAPCYVRFLPCRAVAIECEIFSNYQIRYTLCLLSADIVRFCTICTHSLVPLLLFYQFTFSMRRNSCPYSRFHYSKYSRKGSFKTSIQCPIAWIQLCSKSVSIFVRVLDSKEVKRTKFCTHCRI